MKDELHIKCLNPRFVRNKYTGDYILAECGKCEHCLLKKSVHRTQLCKLESSVHRYHYFVTLTFANEYLPKARLVLTDEANEKYDVVRESDGLVLGNVSFPRRIDKIFLCKKVGMPVNVIPILDYEVCKLFLKRLRKYISKYSNEKIRYFVCGEYGPVHFRPHFHLSLWFDEDATASCIQQAVRACWPFGRVDVSLSSGKSASYVASYINSNMYLPRIFKLRGTAPLSRHSFYLGERFYESEIKEIQQVEYSRVARKRICFNGFNSDVFLWRSLESRLFPKCKGFANESQFERVLSYSAYAIARNWTKETRPVHLARFVTDYIRYEDFCHPDNTINDWLQLIRFGLNYYDSDGKFIRPCLCDYDKLERSIYMMLLFSRRFLSVHCCGDDSFHSVSMAIDRIDRYYKDKDYDGLREQLFQQEQTKVTGVKHHYFHYNCVFLDEMLHSSVFKNHSSAIKTKFGSFVKHKKLNDLNKFFNY